MNLPCSVYSTDMTTDKDKSEDSDLFRRTVGPVQPLKNEPRHIEKNRLAGKVPIQSTLNSSIPFNLSTMQDDWDYAESLEPLHMLDQSISHVFARPGMQHRTMKQLRRGKIPLESILDLHGTTAIQARRRLHDFITMSIINKNRAVIIVHGKGMRSENNTPVLKTRVNYWLRENENVLGFCPAAQQHGGSGALYVLLKTGKNK